MTQAVLVGGLFIGVLSALPIVNVANCCCLWVIAGGSIAVWLARHERVGGIRSLDGARIGFRAGLVGAVVWLVVSLLVDAVMAPLQQRLAEVTLRSAADLPPDVRTWLQGLGQTSEPIRLILGFLLQLCVAAPFAALGGLLAATLLGHEPADTDVAT